MLTLLILMILLLALYSGYKSGSIKELIKAVGYTISFIISVNYYKSVSKYLELIIPYPTPHIPDQNPFYFYNKKYIFSLDQTYYYIISVLLIMFIGWLMTQFLTKIISFYLTEIKVVEPYNRYIGAAVSFLIKYVGILYLLFLLTTIPLNFIQSRLSQSIIVDKIVFSTPILSKYNYNKFVKQAHSEVEKNKPLMDVSDPTQKYEIEDKESEE